MRTQLCRNVANDKGMTLMEVLAVIVILGILAAVAVPIYLNVIHDSRTNAFVSNSYAFRDAANFYMKDKVMRGDSVTEISYQELVEAGFLDEIVDPDTREYWDPSNNKSYVTASGNKVVGLCLYGDERKLCGGEGEDEAPVPFEDLSPDLVTDK
ncbi:type II secretion system protein [Peribacillus sp. NPDC097675]|uniref:type II secretion system protein n=1 Tax=Peribacillus sp. NPDC097675 TaxID=3390618 RepID=UPI003D0279D0